MHGVFFQLPSLPSVSCRMQNSYVLLDDLIVIFVCCEHFRCGDASSDDFFYHCWSLTLAAVPVRTKCLTNQQKNTLRMYFLLHYTFFGFQFTSIMHCMVVFTFLCWTQYFRLILKDSEEDVQIVFFSPGFDYSCIKHLYVFMFIIQNCQLWTPNERAALSKRELIFYVDRNVFFFNNCCHCLRHHRHYMVWVLFLQEFKL